MFVMLRPIVSTGELVLKQFYAHLEDLAGYCCFLFRLPYKIASGLILVVGNFWFRVLWFRVFVCLYSVFRLYAAPIVCIDDVCYISYRNDVCNLA